jgi:nitronate monooxygenase
MKTSTRFTDLIGCRLPLQLAAMGGVGTTELAMVVEASGGLGMVPSPEPPASGACGVNFLVPFAPPPEAVGEVARTARVVEFFYGDPDRRLVDAARSGGAIVGWQVGSADEALAAADAGCDYIVAQGIEAGGHVRGTQPLDEVVPAVLAAVRLPVVAAGGIATPRRVVEVMSMSADAVRVGTRFVTTPESGAHPDYVASLLAARGGDTVLTEWFGEGWPDAPHRVIRCVLDPARRSGWRETVPPYRGVERTTSDMAMYAGMGVGEVTSSQPAAEVVADLVRLL